MLSTEFLTSIFQRFTFMPFMKRVPFLMLFVSLPLIAVRVPWNASSIQGLPGPPEPYNLERVFPGLTFVNPVEMVWSPVLNKFTLLEVEGKVFSFADEQGETEAQLMVDLKTQVGTERAYGLVFHPGFENNRFIYICYITELDEENGTKVSQFIVRNTDPPTIDPASEKIIITWKSGGHNGCSLQFGPDGYLYISTGDGTPPAPPDGLNTGQDISDLLGAVLRIDVNNTEEGKPYRIPADNPFVDFEAARPEVWAYGFRNPWRMSFDQKSGELWLGDVGWEKMEMIYKVRSGGNYGWSVTEGSQPVKPNDPRGPTPILSPTIEHPHTEAKSITGGFVYFGRRLDNLSGAYIYGDYITGKIWGLHEKDKWHRELTDSTIRIICFAPNKEGELYIVDYGGSIYRLVENHTIAEANSFPQKLSETGLFSDKKEFRLAPGVIPYTINAEAWHDHARAQRVVAFPGTTQLGVYEETDGYKGYQEGAWSFPEGSVIAKTLSLEMEAGNPNSTRKIETQVLHRYKDQWHAVNYLWNDDQTDADLAPDEASDSVYKVKDSWAPGGVRMQSWHHASRTECILCHNNRTGNTRSFNLAQLNVGDQLDRFAENGFFQKPLPGVRPKITNPHDSEANLDERARAYLHVNCTHCHTRGGGGTAMFQTRLEFDLEDTVLVNSKPTQGDLGIQNPHLITPGDPYRSVLYHRMAKHGPGRMPHFGSRVIDQKGLALIRKWIYKMSPQDTKPTAEIHDGALKDFKAGSLLAAEKLLSKVESALLLADTFAGKDLNQGNILAAIDKAASHQNVFVRDLFLHFQEQSLTTNRIGLSPSSAEILALEGDRQRGRTLFRRADILCLNCHRVDGMGREFGPDLDGIGRKFNREQLLDQILRPSNMIHPDYVIQEVELLNGKRLSGFIRQRSGMGIVLRDAANQDHHIASNKIQEIRPSLYSAMPQGITQNLTAQEAADLVDYLRSLK